MVPKCVFIVLFVLSYTTESAVSFKETSELIHISEYKKQDTLKEMAISKK